MTDPIALLITLLPNKPTPTVLWTDLKISGVSLVALIIILLFTAYTMVKLRYGKTNREALKLGTDLVISLFKEMVIFYSRLILLDLIMFLPIGGIVFFTTLYVSSLYVMMTKPQAQFSYLIYLIPASLVAIALIIYYFLGRYGAIYRLPFILLKRMNTMLSSTDCLVSWGALLIGSIIYMTMIGALLMSLINMPSLPILLKINLGVIVAILIAYVLPRRKPNKQFENSMNLWKKVSGCDPDKMNDKPRPLGRGGSQ